MSSRDIYDGEPWSDMAIEDLKQHVAARATLKATADFLCRSGDVAKKAKELAECRPPTQIDGPEQDAGTTHRALAPAVGRCRAAKGVCRGHLARHTKVTAQSDAKKKARSIRAFLLDVTDAPAMAAGVSLGAG